MNKMVIFFVGIITLSAVPAFADFENDRTVPNVFVKTGLDTSRKIEMTCGGTKVELRCGYNKNFRQMDDRICNDNTLIFTLPDGSIAIPDVPEVLKKQDYTPISISCREEFKNPQNLFIYTRYQNGSYNCIKDSHGCNIEVIFDLNAKNIKTTDINLDSYSNTISIEERNRDYPNDYLFKVDGE